jgi:hypothetical protein
VPVPVPLTARTAATFAGAVSLTRADITGGAAQAPSKSPRRDEQEAAKCGGLSAKAIGGGRSQEFVRGKGLDRENFSSSVEVLSSEASVRRDLEYAESSAGLRCYSRVVGKNLQAEEHARMQLLGVKVTPIRVRMSDGQSAAGVRIAARVGVPQAGLAVALYSDAVSLPYGPAELNLYATSFVQPVPVRTQQQLLTLMRERARLSRL